jgi:DNA-binding transcriptional LysR family regulator
MSARPSARRGSETASRRRRKSSSAETQPLTGQRFARSLDWNLLKTFHEIVQADGISEAARRTSRKQPALSMALQRLEEHLETTLCRRGPGGFSLTHEGEALASLCETVYGSVQGIPGDLAHMSSELRGRVRIQLISNLVDRSIDRAIESFHRAHGQVEVFVSVTTWDVIKRSILLNEVEIGIAPAQDKDPRLRYELLFQEIYRAYCGRAHTSGAMWPAYRSTWKRPSGSPCSASACVFFRSPSPPVRSRRASSRPCWPGAGTPPRIFSSYPIPTLRPTGRGTPCSIISGKPPGQPDRAVGRDARADLRRVNSSISLMN